MISTNDILNNPRLIEAQFKRCIEERKRIKLLFTLKLIEEILKS